MPFLNDNVDLLCGNHKVNATKRRESQTRMSHTSESSVGCSAGIRNQAGGSFTGFDSCLNAKRIISDLAKQLATAPINPTEVIVC